MKRVLSLFLTVVMLLCSSITATCATDIDSLSKDDQIVVGRLAALDIMFGKDAGFDPDAILTRAEATAIIVRVNGISDEQAMSEGNFTSFDDVEAGVWYTGYINIARSKGLVFGVGKNKFAPDRKLSYQEMLAMLTRSLGAEQLVSSLGVWPTNYINFAIDNNLVQGVGRNFSAEINRLETARLVSNVLEANLWQTVLATTDGTATYKKTDKILLQNKLDVYVYNSNDINADKKDRETYIVEEIDTKDREITISNIGTRDVADFVDMTKVLKGMEVDVWLDKDREIVRIVASKNTDQETITIYEVKSLDDEEIKIDNGTKDKAYDFVSDLDDLIIYINEELSDFDDLKDALDTVAKKENSFGKLILNSKGDVTHIFIEQYSNAILVKKVDTDKEKIYAQDDIEGSTCKDLNLEDLSYIIKSEDGKEVALSDISKGDVILYYKAKGDRDYGMLVLKDNKVKGEVDGISTKYVKVDGDKYYVNNLINTNSLIKKLDNDEDVVLYLDQNDKIVMIECDDKVSGEYGVITSARAYENGYGELTAKIKITYTDGSVSDEKEIDIEEIEGEDGFNRNIFEKTKDYLDAQLYKINNSLLGTLVRIEEDDDEFIIIEFVDSFINVNNGSGLDDEDNIYELPNGYKLNIDASKISPQTVSGKTYRITSSTKVMIEKSTTKAYTTKAEEVEWDSLKDAITSDSLNVTIAGIDEDTNEVEVVYIRGDVSRNTSANFGIIVDMYYDDDDNYVAEVITNDGSVDLTIEDDSIKKSELEKYEGALICYSESGDELYEPEIRIAKYTGDKKDLNLVKVYSMNTSSNVIRVSYPDSISADDSEIIDLSEDLVVIVCDSIELDLNGIYKFDNMKLKLGAEPDTLNSNDWYSNDSSNAQMVYMYMIDTDNDNQLDQVVAIIFEK